MSLYASDTTVGVDRSRAEIERTILRYGGDDVVTGQSARLRSAFVNFIYETLPISVTIPLADPDGEEFSQTPTGRKRRNPNAARAAWERQSRQQWRVLLLLIRAKLEAIRNGIATAKMEFLPWLMLPSGKTVGQAMEPGLDRYLASGQMPKALPGFVPAEKQG